MTGPIGVLIVDDHAVVREGYRRLLERAEGLVVTGEAASAAEAYQAYCQNRPDVVVMDISLADVSGIEAMRRLLLRDPHARVLMFSIHDEPIFPDRAFKAGACGYVSKASAPDVLVSAVRAVARGEKFLSPDIAQTLALRNVVQRDETLGALSDREFEVLRLIVHGHSIHTIAERMCLSQKTVSNYQTAIRRKLGAVTGIQLLRIAARNGMTPGGA